MLKKIGNREWIFILISFLSFFIGRVVIFQNLNPIAIAFLSNFLLGGKIFYSVAVFTLLGFATKFDTFYIIKYLLCIIFMIIGNILLSDRKNGDTTGIKAIIGSVSMLVSGLIIAVINGFSLFYTVIAILESVLTFMMSLVMKKSTDILKLNKNNGYINTETILSLSVIFSAIVAGSSDVYLFNTSVMYFFVILFILVVSYKCGVSISTSATIILSAILFMSAKLQMEMFVVLSLSAMACGIFKNTNKIFIILSFAAAFFALGFYIDSSAITNEIIYSVVMAAIVFILIPQKIYMDINSSIIAQPRYNDKEYINKIKDITNHRLRSFSNSFLRLSRTFNSLSEKKTSLNQKDISGIIDDVVGKVCQRCDMSKFCWSENFYNTYQSVFGILSACEKKGKIYIEDIPLEFKNVCVHKEVFADNINKNLELYKLNLKWKNRIMESRELIGEQLKGIANIISNFSNELDMKFNFEDKIGDVISAELIKNNINTESLVVMNNCNKREVIITHNACNNKGICNKYIVPIVSRILGKPMCKSCYECITNSNGEKHYCKLKLIEEQNFNISTGIAREIKSGSKESGDSYTFMEITKGKYLLALSDGMGSGEKAREESAAAIELFEEFMSAGFDKSLAINIINSALFLKSEADSFSTLDICIVDLYKGIGDFAKIGAVSTFIIRDDEVKVIKSSSLPVGILDSVDIETNQVKLKDSHIIVMVTDGITDSKNAVDKDGWLVEILNKCRDKSPQYIADFVLNSAKSNYSFIDDDMTVLTAKIWEKLS